MSNMLDKKGNELKGGAAWLRTLANDGGLIAHDKKVALQAFADFLEYRPLIASAIVNAEAEEKRKSFKIIK